MADPKWTPGPWEAGIGGVVANNRTILVANSPAFDSVEQMRATLCLAAAAPDLYRDLCELADYTKWLLTDSHGWSETSAEAFLRSFTESLRKARGEQNRKGVSPVDEVTTRVVVRDFRRNTVWEGGVLGDEVRIRILNKVDDGSEITFRDVDTVEIEIYEQ